MRGLVIGLIAALCLGACGGDEGPERGVFSAAAQADYPLGCLEHQESLPSEIYTGDEQRETLAILEMLRYYTANSGVRTYCDGAGPTEIDRAWAQLYVDLGAKRENVAHLLG